MADVVILVGRREGSRRQVGWLIKLYPLLLTTAVNLPEKTVA
jgi:hypothetical protein